MDTSTLQKGSQQWDTKASGQSTRPKSPIIIQGFTGQMGSFHAKEMIEYGSNVVGGVTPGKGGESHPGHPVFNSVKVAVAQTGARASLVFVPPAFASDGIMEAAEAGIEYCVSITDGIPAQDMLRVKRYMRRFKQENRMCLTGPNCAFPGGVWSVCCGDSLSFGSMMMTFIQAPCTLCGIYNPLCVQS